MSFHFPMPVFTPLACLFTAPILCFLYSLACLFTPPSLPFDNPLPVILHPLVCHFTPSFCCPVPTTYPSLYSPLPVLLYPLPVFFITPLSVFLTPTGLSFFAATCFNLLPVFLLPLFFYFMLPSISVRSGMVKNVRRSLPYDPIRSKTNEIRISETDQNFEKF